ncbi:MAG: recombinase family protein, partial [Ruminococcus sp.]|nr:recombinase family protein [Ruminococcus sp.]
NIHSIEYAGELLLTLMAAFAESESKNMSENITWGKRRRFEQGLVEAITVSNLLGFRQNNGVITVVKEEAKTVRRIFREFLDFYSMAEITQGLIRDKIPTRFNGKWEITLVRNILTNEKYAGDCMLQKRYIINPIEHRSAINTGQLTRYLVEGCYPAIIKKEDWLVVQEMIKRIPNKSASNSEERPFVGMLYCSVCGKAYKIHTTIGMGGHHLRRYRCRSFKDNSGVEVSGMTYVRPHTARYTKNPTQKLIEYREKYVPKPVPRQYLCSDTRVEADYPYKAFVKAWNHLVSRKQRYLVTIYNSKSAEDILLRYNATVMYKLLSESDRLKEFDTRLFRKTVERIDVSPPDKLTFVFKAGVKVTV